MLPKKLTRMLWPWIRSVNWQIHNAFAHSAVLAFSGRRRWPLQWADADNAQQNAAMDEVGNCMIHL
jgi:hypothetical protein